MGAIMDYIFASGTGCAGRTAGWAVSRLLLGAAAMTVPATPALAASLNLTLEGLRNRSGQVHLCLTRDQAFFPDCSRDPHAVKRSLGTAQAGQLTIEAPPGDYALSVVHDQTGNGRLDTVLGIPREGFGFSRNPAIRMGPPRFRDTRFTLPAQGATFAVRIRYIL